MDCDILFIAENAAFNALLTISIYYIGTRKEKNITSKRFSVQLHYMKEPSSRASELIKNLQSAQKC